MNLTPLRRAIAAAAFISLSLSLTACGSDDAAGNDPTSATSLSTSSEEPTDEAGGVVLDEDQLSTALLTGDDLPGGFVDDPDDGDDSDSGGFEGSCLEEVGKLTDQPEFDADAKVEAAFVLDGDAGQSSLKSQVQSYADEQQVVTAISMFSEVVGACESAQGTDADGLTFDLDVLSDQTVSLSGVDEQARVSIKGSIATEGLELPVDIGYNVARVGNNLVIVSTLDVGEAGDGIVPQTDTLAQVSVDRLAETIG